MSLLISTLNSKQIAFDVSYIERIFLAVEMTPFPKSPDYIAGLINIHGEAVSVYDPRILLNLPRKELELNDHFILCRVYQKPMILWVDHVLLVIPKPKILTETKFQNLKNAPAGQSVFHEKDQLIFHYDLENLIPLEVLK
ncbi:chemotaxis protein CheW [Criblamydia sequanensis]|uniref:Chemotaxis protein CheW n=1 Tax=Candidatus Criblamydia sequanensis CRIB-18 TaxID=1437425 RepID=A0A090D0S5_9BACT|nr:chemotaxis protein CheW [Criblamydia sequanensis]CDR33178.1 Chemotaxis protein CheW [Criblamydia sequanensis CRIB-18]